MLPFPKWYSSKVVGPLKKLLVPCLALLIWGGCSKSANTGGTLGFPDQPSD
ncbi:MAG: hypothetical protein ACI9WU_005246, partial [Myxococcota bacterium]